MDDIQLVMKVDTAPVDRAVRVMDNLEAELRDVDRAMSKGLITEKQYNAETQRLTQSMTRLKTVAKGSSKDFRAFEKTVYGSGKAMRQKEIAMQQAGYQLQDFIVQVQAGTNPLIAFSQQGSQLAGFFAGPWGAAIGLGIAALGGLGTALLGTSFKAKTLYDETESFIKLMDDYQDAADSAGEGATSLADSFGNLASTVREARDAILELRQAQLDQQMSQMFGQFREQYVQGGGGDRRSALATLFGFKMTGRGFKDPEGNLRGGQIGELMSFMAAAESAETNEERLKFLQMALTTAKDLADVTGGFTEDEQALLSSIENVYKAFEGAVEKTTKAATDSIAEVTMEAFGGKGRSQSDIQAGLQILKDIAAEEERLRAARIKANLENATRENAERIQLAEDQEIVRNALALHYAGKRADEEKRLADQTHAHMLGLQEAYYEHAKKKAVEGAEASYLANYNAVLGYMQYGETRSAAPTTPVKPKKTPSTKVSRDVLGDMLKEVQHKTKLLDLTEEQIRAEKIRYELEKAGVKNTDDRIDKLIKESEAYYKLNEERDKQQVRIDQIGDAFGDMLMSVVDGTAKADEAFKSFMSSVLKQLYQEMAIDPAVSFLKSFLADGGVMSRGRLTAFANGGVVNGPTVFPMANGMGLMGEAGPEAIMPLKRGANGKLGVEGGGGVTIVQNINVSTGVQQTVRTEIKSLMPQIAEASKAAVADAKRRGGSYGRNFA